MMKHARSDINKVTLMMKTCPEWIRIIDQKHRTLPLDYRARCNRLRCPLARMSGLQCFNMGHNGHGINLYGVSMTLMGN